MRTLPLPARLYLCLIVAAATLSCALIAPEAAALLDTPALALLIFVSLLFAYRAEVSFESRPGHNITFTVDDAVAIFCVSTLGLPGTLIAAPALGLSLALRRTPPTRIAFNMAMLSITYCLSSLVYSAMQSPAAAPFGGPSGPLVFLSVAATYYSSNMLLVSVMIGLASGRPVLQIYRDNLLQVSWVYLLTYSIGAGMAALYAVDPWLLLYGVITLVVARYAFATVVALNDETRRRQELAEERAALYEEQARLNTELARSAKLAALGTFSAGISHEFNNVLSAIHGRAQLGQHLKDPAAKDESFEVIARACMRATSITSSLLTFARQREPDLSLALLQTAIAETLDIVHQDLEADRVALVQQIADLPPILCDIGQLNQVLLNLITNARDALRGRPDAEIRLGLAHVGEQAVITIADNGPGIPPEVLDKLFQPFVTTKKRGNGLGMAICYGIVSGHKGTIDITSELGVGTVVTVRLPMRTEEPPAVLPEPDELVEATV